MGRTLIKHKLRGMDNNKLRIGEAREIKVLRPKTCRHALPRINCNGRIRKRRSDTGVDRRKKKRFG
jgi:hypothetical protein